MDLASQRDNTHDGSPASTPLIDWWSSIASVAETAIVSITQFARCSLLSRDGRRFQRGEHLPTRSPPSAMKKPFNRSEERFVHSESDHDDDQHDPDHLIHRAQLSSIM